MKTKRKGKNSGFTLAELLVVIAIITMLVAMALPAVFGALRDAKQTAIRLEAGTLDKAIKVYKERYGSYPPMLSDRDAVNRHLVSRFRERASNDENPPTDGDAAESLVYWLSGFGDDPEYPIRDKHQGEAGLALFGFDKERLCQVSSDGNELKCGEEVNRNTRQGLTKYYPKGQTKPFVYFDGSRFDRNGRSSYERFSYRDDDESLRPYTRKRNASQGNSDQRIFVNEGSFQIISAGLDDLYGNGGEFPNGPYGEGGDDNLTNFTDRTLEGAKK